MKRSKSHKVFCGHMNEKPHLYATKSFYFCSGNPDKNYGYEFVWTCVHGFYSVEKHGRTPREAYNKMAEAIYK